jgi:hypothetical protein
LFTTNDENRKMTQKVGCGFFFFLGCSDSSRKETTVHRVATLHELLYGISTLAEINHPLQNTFKGPTRTTIAMANLHHITHICDV